MLVRDPLPHGPGFRASVHVLQKLLQPRTFLLLAVAAAITFDTATVLDGWVLPACIGLTVAAAALYFTSRKKDPSSTDDSTEH